MRRLVAAACAGFALGACSAGDPVTIGTTTTSTAVPTTVTTLAPTTSTTLTPQADLAAKLTAAETAIRNPATPAAQLPALGQTQQQAYRSLVAHPEWDAEV